MNCEIYKLFKDEFEGYRPDTEFKISQKLKSNGDDEDYYRFELIHNNAESDPTVGKVVKYTKLDGQTLHRENDEPARICYYRNGKVSSMAWFKNGKLYRSKNPAWINYDENGKPRNERWHTSGSGKIHRDDGPAFINYTNNKEEWYEEGKKINPKKDKEEIFG